MREATPHYEAGLGIRPPRKGGRVRGVAREVVPGGGMELHHCGHDHAPGVRDCRKLTDSQRAEAQACSKAWLEQEINAGRLYPMPVLTEAEAETAAAADALVLSLEDFEALTGVRLPPPDEGRAAGS